MSEKTIQAYEDFRGVSPDSVVEIPLPENDQNAWHMGTVEGIAYRTEREGETEHYFHEFKRDSGPDLIVDESGSKLHLTGGDFTVTDRGIEDNYTMPSLLVVNPHKRGEKKRKVSVMARRKRRSTASKAAPKTIIIRSNPAPKKRRKRSTGLRYAANPVRPLRRKRYRRNPIGGGGRGSLALGSMLVPAAMQGAGAVGVSLLVRALPIPANLKSGSLLGATKAAVGIGLGMLVAKFASKKFGQAIAEGALTIAVFDAVSGAVPKSLGGNMGQIYQDEMGNLLSYDENGELSYVSAANVVQESDGIVI